MNKTITNNGNPIIYEINTINLGMGGNSPYEYKAVLKSIIQPLVENSTKINSVVLIFSPNDNIKTNPRKEKLIKSINPIINFSHYQIF